jgi:hypothetical protein
MTRTDIPNSHLQVLDLSPNTSQRNLTLDPPGQTKYARRPDNDTVGTLGAGPITTAAAYSGIAAWLIDTIVDDPNGDAFTAAQANASALAIIALLDTGSAMTTGAINITITVAGSGIGIGTSTGTLAELLEIMSGAVYTVPAGSVVDTDGSTWNPTVLGSLTHSRHIVSSGAFNISRGAVGGRLEHFMRAAFTYDGTAGAAIVLYADDGTILT